MSKCQKDVKMSIRCLNVNKMSKCQKDVKLSKSQTHTTMEEVHKKINSHNGSSHIMTSILMSNMKVTKIVQKHFLCTF